MIIGGLIKYLNLESWFNSFSGVEQAKIIHYYGEDIIKGNILNTSQTEKSLISVISSNALFYNDLDFAILLTKEGLKAKGKSVDQHFIYNNLVDAFLRKRDYENVKRYCYEELEEWQYIQIELLKEFDNELPPVIPFRDTLIHILRDIEKNYLELRNVYQLFLKNKVINEDELENYLQELDVLELLEKAYELLRKDDYKKAIEVFNKAILKDCSVEPEVYKKLGNYFFDKRAYNESLGYFEKSVKINPLISGVKSKIKKISKILKTDVKDNILNVISFLQEREKTATQWWGKRDLANEYVKIREYDKAWTLFNEAILLRVKDGMPCETIYSHMANMLIREKNYKNALLQYAFYFSEWLSFSKKTDFPKYVIYGINKCLYEIGKTNFTYLDFYNEVKKVSDKNELSKLINRIL